MKSNYDNNIALKNYICLILGQLTCESRLPISILLMKKKLFTKEDLKHIRAELEYAHQIRLANYKKNKSLREANKARLSQIIINKLDNESAI